MAINFRQLVESQLILEQFDPKKPLYTSVKNILQTVYQNAINQGKTVDQLYNDYFVNIGRDIDRGGIGYKTDDQLRTNRYYWPIIDTGNKILYALENNIKNFEQIVLSNSTNSLEQELTTRYPQNYQQIQDTIKNYVDLLNQPPQDYKQFSNYRLQKLNTSLTQLTIQKYNSYSIINGITEMAAQRGFKDKNLILKILTAPLDYLTGTSPLPENFDSGIVNIAGSLFKFFQETEQAQGKTLDNTTGTSSGKSTQDGKNYIAFIQGTSTMAPYDKIKNIGDLAQSAPGVYSKIEEYSYHIRRGDPPFKAFMKKIGKGVETFTKGLEDIGSAISRF